MSDDRIFEWKDGKLNYVKGSWKRFFKMRVFDILVILFIIFSVYAYKHDTAQCWQAYTNPCGSCNCCEILDAQSGGGTFKMNWSVNLTNGLDIPNSTMQTSNGRG